MKIKDLPKIGGARFRYPGDGKLYYWHSQWQKGVWGKKDLSSDKVFPLFCENLTDALDWEVLQPLKVKL